MASKSKFKNNNLNAKLGYTQKPPETRKSQGTSPFDLFLCANMTHPLLSFDILHTNFFATRYAFLCISPLLALSLFHPQHYYSLTGSGSGFAIMRGGDSRRVAKPVGAAAAPMPVNTSSLKRENNGMDTSVNLVPLGKGACWGMDPAADSPAAGVNANTSAPSHAQSQPQQAVAPEGVQVQGVVPISKSRAWADMSDDEDDDRRRSGIRGNNSNIGVAFGLGGSLSGLGGALGSGMNGNAQQGQHRPPDNQLPSQQYGQPVAQLGRGLMGDARGAGQSQQPQFGRDRSDSGSGGASWRDSFGGPNANSGGSSGYSGGAFPDRFINNNNRHMPGGFNGYENPRGNFGADVRAGSGRERSGSYGNDFRNASMGPGPGAGNMGGARGGPGKGTELFSGGGSLGLGGTGFSGGMSAPVQQMQDLSEAGQIERTRLEMERVKIAKQQKAQREAEDRMRQEQQQQLQMQQQQRDQQERREREMRMQQMQQQQRILDRSDDFDPRAARGSQVTYSYNDSQWGRVSVEQYKPEPEPARRHVPVPPSSLLVPAWGGAGVAALGGGVKTLVEIQAAEELAALRAAADEAKTKAQAMARASSQGQKPKDAVIGSSPTKGTTPVVVSNPHGRQLFDPKSKSMVTPQDMTTSKASSIKGPPASPSTTAGRKGPAAERIGEKAAAPTLLQRTEGRGKPSAGKSASATATSVPASALSRAPASAPKKADPMPVPVVMPTKPPVPEVSAGPTETKIIRASGISSSGSSNGNIDNRNISPPPSTSERQANSSISISNDGNAGRGKSSVVAEAPAAKPHNPLEGWMPRDNRDITRDMYEVRDNRDLAREISLASGRGVPAPLRDIVVAPTVPARRPLGGFGFGSDAGAEDSAAAEILRKEREREQAALVRGVGYYAGRGAPRERDVHESAHSQQPHRTTTDMIHVRQPQEVLPSRPERSERSNRSEFIVKDRGGEVRGAFVEPKAGVAAVGPKPASVAETRAADKRDSLRERQRKEKEERLRSRMDTDNGSARVKDAEKTGKRDESAPAASKQTVQLVDKSGKLSGNKAKSESVAPVDVSKSDKQRGNADEKQIKEKKPRLSDEEFASQKAAKKAERLSKKRGDKSPAAGTSGVGTFTLTLSATSSDVPAVLVDSDDEAEPAGAYSSAKTALTTREQNQLAKKKEKFAKMKEERREREKGKRGVMFSEEKAGTAAADLSDLGASIDRLDFASLSQLASPIKSAQSAHNASGVSGDIDGDLYGAASCLDDDMPSHAVVGSVLGGILDDLEGPEDSIFGSNPIPIFSDSPPNGERAPRGGRGTRGKARGGRGRGDGAGKSSSRNPSESAAAAPIVPANDERPERGARGGRGRAGRKSGDREEGGGRGRGSEAGRGSRGRGPPARGPPPDTSAARRGPPATAAK